MSSKERGSSGRLVELTVELLAAYLASNSVERGELAGLVASVHASLNSAVKPQAAAQPEKPSPAVPIKNSVTPDYLISLEDGSRLKMLKRHLAGRGLTPALYREKWGLPAEYPMVAPNYARRRAEIAKAIGLGGKRIAPEPGLEPPLGARPSNGV
jgi:predicted transcriptional regulator